MDEEKKMKAQAARKKYDDENMAILNTKLQKSDADAFRELAAARGTTVSRMLSGFVRDSITEKVSEKVSEDRPTSTNAAVLTYENVERLKHETAFHNPHHYNPDEMLNHILNRYFAFVEEVRK